jgi:phage tail sheath gpL-like
MGIEATAVARGTGVTANFKDLAGGAARFVPQRIAVIAQGESAVTYSTDPITVDSGAGPIGAVLGYKSQAYQIVSELFPKNGETVGTVLVDVYPLPQPAGGAAAVGAIDITPGTATANGTYYPVVGGVRGNGVLVPKGVIDESVVLSDMVDSVNEKLGMPASAALVYGAPVGNDSTNIALSAIAVSGTPKGGAYTIECTDVGSQLFKVLDPKGNVRAVGLAAGVQSVDGLDFTITATVATLGETATIDVAATDTVLTVAWLGATGNDVTLQIDGPTNLGVAWVLTAPAGGAGASTVDDSLTAIGQDWVTMIITPESNTTALDAFQAWGEQRWSELVSKYVVAFYGNTATTPGDAIFVTDGRTGDRITCQLPNPGSRDMPWVVAAAQVNPIASLAQRNPAHDYGSQVCPSLTPGPKTAEWDYSQRDFAIKGGSSTVEIKGGRVNVSDVVTPWKPQGEDPPAYRYVVDIVKLMQVAYNMDLAFNNAAWDGAPLIPSGQATNNPDAKTPDMAKAVVAGVVDGLAAAAIIANPDAAKETIVAVINGSNPKRLDVSVTIQISGNTNIKDVTFNWGFNFGSAAA